MGSHVGQRAVVLGGSMAGLLVARVLAESYAEVLVVDRDELGGSGYRRGVPHGRHAHGLVARGQQILEAQFPGLTQELGEAGVRPGDFSGDIRWYFEGLRLAPAHSGLVAVPATRPVLEHHVRERVRAIPEVTFVDRTEVLGLAYDADRRRVTGARVQRIDAGTAEVLSADLVVACTGRGGRAEGWLAELGYPRPSQERIKIDLSYTTRHYRIDVDPFGTDQAIIPAATPAHPRGAFFYRLPGDDGRLELSLTGILGDHAPTDPDGFLAYVKSLPVPEIYEAVRRAEPIDDPVRFRFPASVRRRFDLLPSAPDGFVVLGDAVCSFNPVYAQGMTVAALQALVLRRHLAEGREPRPLDFFRDASQVIDSPWDFAAVADLGYAGVEGRRTAKTRFVNSYVTRLRAAAVGDSALSTAFFRVAGLIDEPAALMRPRNLIRVLRGPRRGTAEKSTPRPLDAARREP
ncbi:2-polyprenyl-6-methoxyphenol hydroxylase-like FAD-dependent oxidoreductase [Actinoalloteichus hoggarensis]|uniref:Putative epoxidase LasC n=1 Tax=Actinoalloteichus hoggarensis TaxID=1470176 RepID=A0A221W508_9PSEU|nr:FAD-dependent monooxygenase [Actinoalloteichus hoggarensis]ASO20938.1 Putative epoxidase LasC [Actinoalloteichus hoggarensis]MBB5920868.1 2-polyprenyl-6-methoxyphenol hydroxylase-like FAD-dependent oxidoreductase [Actinoalloteichus hoggarensis]